MNCLVVDDNDLARLTLKKLLSLDPALVMVDECPTADMAYQTILNKEIDLLFLDIEMPGMNGIELAKSLAENSTMIVFTTSKRDYAVEAFDLNVVDFIIKPVAPARFLQAVKKAKGIYKLRSQAENDKVQEFIFIRDSNTVKRVRLADILFLEAQGDYVKVVAEGNVYQIHSSLKSVEDKVPKSIFLRVHRSFIINLSKVDTVEGNTLIIDKKFVPVSDAYKATLNKRMRIL
ncbi:LytR/AlgR family response regulator transcription factor [Pedobacter namyangjuensis]|uniref:LytR/AlgR family response regulator transcription factor n=1 Tax=Pedobacter namyangjuensis TaxID=600626 RepID=UPI000DE2A10D|nr:LytTR family DNA-binding domain-containing protein [Pedobacter namyangjuensis]